MLFLDRDGVVSHEGGVYVTTPVDLQLLPGVAEALSMLHKAGWRLFIFTNQAGVAKGYLSLEMLNTIHADLDERLKASGAKLEGIYACPHDSSDGCSCRKPLPGMLERAAKEHSLNLSDCLVVGDSPRDIAAGHAAGCRTVLVLTGHTHVYTPNCFPNPQPYMVCADLISLATTLCSGDEW